MWQYIIDLNNKLLTTKQVIQIVALSKNIVYRCMKTGLFPRPLSLSENIIR
ncbi:AlpA family phage regulatory protein [Synechococcus sp. M16CYN]|uniref:helix-turn-helix transcriptional regulator n=1 Tax=Synechococcus sp. M16CYN TaxID=3103139 RepID=UPI00333E745A